MQNPMKRIAASFGWLAALIVASGPGWRWVTQTQPALPTSWSGGPFA